MVSLLVLVSLLGAETPSPVPSGPPPTPLREIGSVRATVCTTIVVHANSAISDALEDDQDLALIVNRLRTIDLDGANVIERHKRTNELMGLASKIRTAASAGDAEIKRLRDLAATSPDPKRKEELKAFADALGGAIYRQKKVAVDLDKLLTNLDGQRAAFEARNLAGESGDRFGTSGNPFYSPTPRPVESPTPPPVNGQLREAADEFSSRTNLILTDEGTAADHSLGATTGC
jgi:hypothetical protein